ncbi:hypothetical protein BD410DRAFT_193913 [Rickenella mellea]|uniref:Rab-GAP TBC domain-containing protein n=1 Tax=Rickenella mellea TaxID=50990 RepID=A0A4Y7Q671_9AGAM|nr:hypothetical protein BD410DRAFT_193913 [Rickenella mellea]
MESAEIYDDNVGEKTDVDPASSSEGSTARGKWDELRRLSLEDGGFGSRRIAAWTYLLQIESTSSAESPTTGEPTQKEQTEESYSSSLITDLESEDDENEKSVVEHPDERQIKLDTDRSFVIYPVVDDYRERVEMQTDLNDLIVTIFRKHPKLSYFQGYHDIITVLFLTLPKEVQLQCAEKLSIHRLRDAMGKGLEPMVGLLRIMKNILRLADPSYATLLESNAPLPYFALSNLLTLFSHDVPTLALIQHVFDYLLCRPPIATVYLAIAVILTRKEEAIRLQEDGEEGMLHSLLTSLPDLTDGDELEDPPDLPKSELNGQTDVKTGDNSSERHLPSPSMSHERLDDETESTSTKMEGTSHVNSAVTNDGEDPTSPFVHVKELTASYHDGDSTTQSTYLGSSNTLQTHEKQPPPDSASTDDDFEGDSGHLDPSRSIQRIRRPRVALKDLLSKADSLLSLYPPDHPLLAVSSIMGPQSAIFTWSEAIMVDDATAEEMVDHPELIVLPYVDPEDQRRLSDDDEDIDEKGPDARHRRARRKLTKPRRLGSVEKRTVVAGAVLVLGIVVAVYGMRGSASRDGIFGRNGFGHHDRGLRRAGRWASGLLLAASDRILGFGAP